MNKEVNIIVVVICRSDMLLTGVSEILINNISCEIIQIHRSEELVDYPDLKGQILIVATEDEQNRSGEFIRKMLTAVQNIRFLTLNLANDDNYSNQTINLNDSGALIGFKVNEALKAFIPEQNNNYETELTRREIDVLQLVAKGYSNKEIADQLFVSTHTVISHRKNISEKTGIKSASGLTMYAILKKIIDVAEINPDELI